MGVEFHPGAGLEDVNVDKPVQGLLYIAIQPASEVTLEP